MKAILRIFPKEKGVLSGLRRLLLPPLTSKVLTKGPLSVTLCTLNPLWKLLFPSLIRTLSRRYDTMLFDESLKDYPGLYQEPSPWDIFFRRLPEILSLSSNSGFLCPVVVCRQKDIRISKVLEALSQYAKAVTVVTDDNLFFDEIAKDALVFLGLSLNQRELDSVSSSELAVVLSSKGEEKISAQRVIALCETKITTDAPLLSDVSSRSTTDFFSAFPEIRTKHCFLVSDTDAVRNLIWKISKKS